MSYAVVARRSARVAVTVALALAAVGALAAGDLAGAGSSAAAPVYRIWADEYARRGGEPIAYDPVGSTAGMARIRQREADFGASDVVAPKAELKRDGLVMFPTVITGVVPVVNLPGLAAPIRLTGEVLARIYLGEIRYWNAPEIVALNPDAVLPADPIRVVCRSDGSGSTYHFSDYLSKASPAWKARFGVADQHDWPTGFIAVKGSREVSKVVRRTPGAIGYIDYNYVLDDALNGVDLRNAAGNFVAASTEGFREAVVNSRWFSAGDFSESLTDKHGSNAWPITMGTYVAVAGTAGDVRRAARTLRFFAWAYANGDALARQAKFVPLPDKVQANAFAELASVRGNHGELIGIEAFGALIGDSGNGR